MKKVICAAAIAVVLLATHQSEAQNPGFETDRWYVSPMATFIREDTDRNTNNMLGGHFGIGRGFGDGWAVELYAFGNQSDAFDETGQIGIGLDLLYSFLPSGKWRPYLGVGVGHIKTNINDDPTIIVPVTERFDEDNPFAHGAVGFLRQLNGQGLQLRGELRYRADLRDPEDYRDLVYNVGIVMPFGRRPEAPTFDTDGDGVIDGSDRCPGTPPGAAVDSRGCELDSDADGVPDSGDACPDTGAGSRVDGKGCEIDADNDGDGVRNTGDRCPNTPRGTQVDQYGCRTVGDVDGDGVLDNRDRCPRTAPGARVDASGCELSDTIELRGVTFKTNSATLTSASTGVLDQAAATLLRNAGVRVEVQGHTDRTGADSYNLALSQRRAETVRDYLIDKGVSPSTLTAKGYGESQPVADNSTAEGRASNRRVVLKILGR
ncbi:MAG: OmpA family protein [Pseudomonadota bacterium]